jgi:hypothetical protein
MAKNVSLLNKVLNPSRDSLQESLFRNTGITYRNAICLLLGYTASTLLLSSGALTPSGAAWTFALALALTMVLLVLVRPYSEKAVDRFAWGLLVVTIIGFGLGSLIHGYRMWWKWLWHQYLRINEPHEILLEALFLLGVILGFFIVRNWAKDQKEFVSSLSGVLGGAFIATILGDLQKELTPMRAFAYYALGFTISGTLNLIAAARLTATYTNKRTLTSRAILDFLYGSDRARLIDGYFLKNFEEDSDYAKRWLTDTVIQYQKLAQREFAERLEERRKKRLKDRANFKSTHLERDELIEKLDERWRNLEPACAKLRRANDELEKVDAELEIMKAAALEVIETAAEPRPTERESKLRKHRKSVRELIEHLERHCSDHQLAEWKHLDLKLETLKPSYFYYLIAVESVENKEVANNTKAQDVDNDPEYDITYKHIGRDKRESGHDDSEKPNGIDASMFRVGISVLRQQDTLEYLVAAGAYRDPFPYLRSVAGLALQLPHTIIMDLDIDRSFRSKSHKEGIRPRDIEQARGPDIIDFLSYVSIPVVSRLGKTSENRLGVVHIDTKLFVARAKLDGKPVKGAHGTYRTRLRRSELVMLGNNLYEHDDEAVKYLVELTRIITPVLELYLKCRVGAT